MAQEVAVDRTNSISFNIYDQVLHEERRPRLTVYHRETVSIKIRVGKLIRVPLYTSLRSSRSRVFTIPTPHRVRIPTVRFIHTMSIAQSYKVAHFSLDRSPFDKPSFSAFLSFFPFHHHKTSSVHSLALGEGQLVNGETANAAIKVDRRGDAIPRRGRKG